MGVDGEGQAIAFCGLLRWAFGPPGLHENMAYHERRIPSRDRQGAVVPKQSATREAAFSTPSPYPVDRRYLLNIGGVSASRSNCGARSFSGIATSTNAG